MPDDADFANTPPNQPNAYGPPTTPSRRPPTPEQYRLEHGGFGPPDDTSDKMS